MTAMGKGKGKKGGKRSGGGSASNYWQNFYHGSAAESNKPRRRDMERLRERRDAYLLKKYDLLKFFLSDNDYFRRKERRDREKEKGKDKDNEKLKEYKTSSQGVIPRFLFDYQISEMINLGKSFANEAKIMKKKIYKSVEF